MEVEARMDLQGPEESLIQMGERTDQQGPEVLQLPQVLSMV
jgi:hypothetical protein